MTRRPIFTGMATILALVLTAGLAYGAGRVVGTRRTASHAARRGSERVVTVVPGFWGTSVHGQFHAGTAYREQMRRWMRGRFHSRMNRAAFAGSPLANRNRVHASTRGTRAGTYYQGNRSRYSGSNYQDQSAYHHDHHLGSGTWGNGSGYRHNHHRGCCGWC